MESKNIYLYILISLLTLSVYSQKRFTIINNKSSKIPFRLINNLIIIDVEINGKKLPFLFDSGVDKTILFNLKFSDSLDLKDTEKIELHGLGEGKPIQALKSKNNTLKLKNIVGTNQMLYVLLDSQFDLSAKMGVDINGIIGGSLFKDFIVKINYNSKNLVFYNPKLYKYKKCKDCSTLPLIFYNRKPLITVSLANNSRELFDVNLLIDSGGGDAIWLFENTHPKIVPPEKYFDDFLGKGLSGNIYGKKSRIKTLLIGDFMLNNVSVSYPDSASIVQAKNNAFRHGTIGAEILRRFHIIFDYPNGKITLKKNASTFKSPFIYNKSGIEIVYGSDVLVKEINMNKAVRFSTNEKKNNSINRIFYTYGLSYKPSYEISYVRKKSPAGIEGLRAGDILLEINGKNVFDFKLQEIVRILSGRTNKKISFLINRNGKELKYQIILKDLF